MRVFKTRSNASALNVMQMRESSGSAKRTPAKLCSRWLSINQIGPQFGTWNGARDEHPAARLTNLHSFTPLSRQASQAKLGAGSWSKSDTARRASHDGSDHADTKYKARKQAKNASGGDILKWPPKKMIVRVRNGTGSVTI
jgi:hypothetical protein